MQTFHVQIKGPSGVRCFEAMACDGCTVAMQHMDLCEPGEKMDIQPLEKYRASLRASGEVSDQQSKAYQREIERQVDRNNAQGFTHG